MFGNIAEIKEMIDKAKEAFEGKELIFAMTTKTKDGQYKTFGIAETLEEANSFLKNEPYNFVVVGFRNKSE